MKETYNLEFKEIVNKTFLKTVSAFANYNNGSILFGITDDGKAKGFNKDELKSLKEKIENLINTTITPKPFFRLLEEKINGNYIIRLNVFRGENTPYLYQSQAYCRMDTSTVKISNIELKRLILKGMNLNFEDQKSTSTNLTFETLEKWLKEKINLKEVNLEILKTLNLYNDGYTIAGELLADENEIEFSGVDIVRFGDNINQILFRETISKKSLLIQFERTLEIFKQYYQYEEIEGFIRKRKELIPLEAFREALANALIHRVWDINSFIQVAMFKDKVVISSPGGLPEGINEDDYFKYTSSVLRNPNIANLFYRLKIIEKLGTGVYRINQAYQDSISKPIFKFTEHRVMVTLPTLLSKIPNLTVDENIIFNALKEAMLSRLELEEITNFTKSKTIRLLNSLIEKKIVKKIGDGTTTKYKSIV
ncbi:MAG: AAA family ATPase [Acholeplasmataceae bacterium]|jgi:ATP-dependent DNA helicase RecG|nr:AAA family ATPase [Acholeplasmataceae bacterium]